MTYPRSGQRLAPVTLRDVLNVPVPRRLLGSGCKDIIRFADLDESAWTRFGSDVCKSLGQELIEHVRKKIPLFPEAVKKRRLPQVPEGTPVEALEIEPRTYNCLCKMQQFGLLKDAHDLGSKTIGQLLTLGGFGAKCLVDLLTSLETVVPGQVKSNSKEELDGQTNKVGERRDEPALPVPLSAFRNLRLPRLPKSLRFDDLPLKGWTRNCLERHGFHERLHDLENCTVGDLMALPRFGPNCLYDLLRAIESYRNGCSEDSTVLESSSAISKAPCKKDVSLEDELLSLVAWASHSRNPSPSDRNSCIAVQHFGFDGRGGLTLKEIGDTYGLTRERVRQICLRVRRAIKCEMPETPILDKSLALVASHIPGEVDAIEYKLQEAGLTTSRFRLEGLAKAALILGRKVPFELEEIDGRRMVAPPERARWVRRTIFLAKKAIARFGVATASDIAALVQEKTALPVTTEFIIRVLERRPSFEWLDRESGWFWLRSTGKNRILSRIRKILSVAGEIDVGELRSGIARHHSMRGFAPPRRVLLKLCEHLPGYCVEGTCVRAEPEIDWRGVLRGIEYTMVQILKQHGPVMQRAKFEELCLGQGMNRSSFYAYLEYSPVIDRFASGVYGLRGAKVNPTIVESLIPEHQHPTTVRLDQGWTSDRKIWVGYRLSEGMLGNGAFSIPAGFRRFLQGSFMLKSVDGLSFGKLVAKDHAGWGLGPFFRRRGGEPGDVLLIVFDVKVMEAVVSIGDEHLLDEYQEPQT